LHSSLPQETADLARVDYWESVWKRRSALRPVSYLNYHDWRMARLLRFLAAPGMRVLEIGCGGSCWMRFFDRTLGCESWGIDYSPEGLRIAAQDNSGSSRIHLVEGDFFDPALLPGKYFDLLYSRGFIEHFTDSTVVTRRMSQLLRPGGQVLTLVPNLVGWYGQVQASVDREIYQKHVPMDCASVDTAHREAGLIPIMPAQFWGCFAPGVVNYGGYSRWLLPSIKVSQQAMCWSLAALHLDFESRQMSPHIVGVYRKLL
jgi:SAM-dependent methyltransferase